MLKRFLVAILILGLAGPLFAQRPRLRQRQQQRLALHRNLTPEQRNTLKSMIEANKAQRDAIRQEIRLKAQVLRELMAQASPNPGDVGNALLGLREARNRARQLREQTVNSFKNTLTPEQRKNLEDGRALRRNRPGNPDID